MFLFFALRSAFGEPINHRRSRLCAELIACYRFALRADKVRLLSCRPVVPGSDTCAGGGCVAVNHGVIANSAAFCMRDEDDIGSRFALRPI